MIIKNTKILCTKIIFHSKEIIQYIDKQQDPMNLML
jgi:hypothetical protein